MVKKFESRSEEETLSIARWLGKLAGRGDIICLRGSLGAGKTYFVKGFAEALGISGDQVNSPTFNLIHEYTGSEGTPLYHFDFYRIERVEEALEIGSEEYFYGDGVSIIEWPEKVSVILPDNVIRVTMTITGTHSRQITIKYPTEQYEQKEHGNPE